MLHTVGRKDRETPHHRADPRKDGDDDVVAASYGGWLQHPAWFLNLHANPRVEVQVGRRRWPATARVAEGDERGHL